MVIGYELSFLDLSRFSGTTGSELKVKKAEVAATLMKDNIGDSKFDQASNLVFVVYDSKTRELDLSSRIDNERGLGITEDRSKAR